MGVGIAAGLAAGALWGLVFVAPRMAAGFSAVDVASLRFMTFGLLALVLLAWGLGRGAARPTGAQMRAALLLSVLGFTGYYTLLVLAVGWAGTAVPALIIGTIPLWLMWLGKPAGLGWARLWPGLLCTAAGLGLMVAADLQHSGLALPAQGRYGWGVGLALLSMASWTAFALLNARWVKAHPEVDSAQWTNWLGVATGLGALLLWSALGTPWAQLSALPGFEMGLAVCIVTGLGSAWLASLLWTMASRRLSASLCGQLIVSETLFALLYAFVWDARWPLPLQWLAAGLFVLGVLASVRAHRDIPTPEEVHL
jgi:drug/metabolite transporter (DMT)-like permease